ncbi:hypothetical protein BT96DRAFT_946301 [Gymnopus androsaceus JB14]|uniref:Uncharacterized protein n=1 Tax=Gymnopus androsaceus JB14 TaxID=1447944 RepID=A0A6A4GWS0_9AGAR|nr:hypothetical protein BT96DRAFT_946301 [Gymnopus androsaceus JB14]
MGNENRKSRDLRVMKNVQKTAKHEAKQGNDNSEAREKQRDSSPMQELMTKQNFLQENVYTRFARDPLWRSFFRVNKCTNTVNNAPANYQCQRYMHFTHHFSKELRRERLHMVVVIFRLRSYLVAGTFDEDLPDENQAIKCLGCTGSFRGDLAICFYNSNRQNELLYGMPRYPSLQARDEALKGVIDRICFYTDGVKKAGENSLPCVAQD